jgi:hypothetical protein
VSPGGTHPFCIVISCRRTGPTILGLPSGAARAYLALRQLPALGCDGRGTKQTELVAVRPRRYDGHGRSDRRDHGSPRGTQPDWPLGPLEADSSGGDCFPAHPKRHSERHKARDRDTAPLRRAHPPLQYGEITKRGGGSLPFPSEAFSHTRYSNRRHGSSSGCSDGYGSDGTASYRHRSRRRSAIRYRRSPT